MAVSNFYKLVINYKLSNFLPIPAWFGTINIFYIKTKWHQFSEKDYYYSSDTQKLSCSSVKWTKSKLIIGEINIFEQFVSKTIHHNIQHLTPKAKVTKIISFFWWLTWKYCITFIRVTNPSVKIFSFMQIFCTFIFQNTWFYFICAYG